MSTRRRNIRFEEYASTGAVTNVVVASTLERVAPSKAPARFAASSSHKDNDAYLAAFDSDPRLPRLNAQAENDDPSTAKAVSPPLPALLAPSTKASAAIDGSARAPWLRGPSDPSGRVDSVSSQPLTCISLAPGGSEVVVGSCDHAFYDKTYRLWDGAMGRRAASGRERHCLKGHDAPILDFSIWGNRLIGGDRNGSVLVFDLSQHAAERKAKGVHTGHCTAVLGSQHSPELAFSGGQDGLLRLWDARAKDAAVTVSFIKDTATMEHVVVTGGADGKVQVVDVRSANVRSTFTEHTTFIYSLHVDHDLCFSGSGSGMLLVHDLRTDALRYGLGANQAAVRGICTTANALAAAGDDGGVLVYNMT
ncbi:hypothetical protein DYB38_013928 [Aphanomyces astaci]|uniref:Uncharacterized protein n=3 Tax=Aphanomyces astaci TaxID=112090 RepID=A0A397EB06_APHAT|nr:hypothetical protein DYB38_013928 [Aphanomyces astaci]